jgi:hypothetical protein
MARRRGSTKKRGSKRKGGGLLIQLVRKLLLLCVIGLICGWIGGTWWGSRTHIKQPTVKSTHAFMVSDTESPTMLVAAQGQAPTTLSDISVIKFDRARNRLISLKLPTNLGKDGAVAGQYVESGYLKELQSLVENQLAVPLDGYILLRRADQPQRELPLRMNVETLMTASETLNVTALLPLRLKDGPVMETSLSATDLWKLLWWMRGLPKSSLALETLPATVLEPSGDALQVRTEKADPIIQEAFVPAGTQDEAVSVVVKNATETSGLAALVARFIRNMGGEVIATEPSDMSIVRSTMTAETSSDLSQELTRFLGTTLTTQPKTGRERGDLEIVLGADVLPRLGK